MPDANVGANPQHATVIISQRVPREHWSAFQREQDELTERVKRFDGFIGTEVLPPRDGVQDEWVVVFRFDSPENLNDWLSSRQRLEVVERFESLLEAPPRMQIIAEPQKEKSVTAVFSHRVKPGKEAEYRTWRKRVLAAQEACGGFIGQETFDPVPGVSQDWVDIARFASAEDLDTWLQSSEREKLVHELKPLLDELSINRVGTGLDGWFRLSRKNSLVEAPPSWKQAVAVLFGLYPTVMLLTLYVNPLFGQTPFSLVMLIGNTLSVALLTWLVMPGVNRLLQPWLLPPKASATRDALGAVGIFAALIALYFLFHWLHTGG